MADDLQAVAAEAADRHGVPKKWFLSLIGDGEGGFRNPEGVSSKGARGPGQLMPATAKAMGVDDVSDPKQNIEGAAKYASQLYHKYDGNTRLASAAYNAGPGAVDRAGGVPKYKETQAYVKKVALPSADELLDAKPLPSADSLLDAKPSTPAKVTPKAPAIGLGDRVMDYGKRELGRIGEDAAKTYREASALPKPSLNPLAGLNRDFNTLGNVGKLIGDVTNLPARPAETLAGKLTSMLPHAPDLPGHPYDPKWGENALATALGGARSPAGLLGGLEDVTQVGRLARLAEERQRMAPPDRNALAATTDAAKYDARVRSLHDKGITDLTPGQIKGGAAKTREDKLTSDPYQGPAIEAKRLNGVKQFNRASYNEVLAPIKQAYLETGPVGHEGLGRVEKAVGQVYDAALAKAKIDDTPEFTADLAALRTRGERLKPDQRKQFEQIINEDILDRFGPNGMDGRTFKEVESKLSQEARRRGGDQDSDVRELGKILRDTKDRLHEQMITSSPPEVAAQLRAADQSWAMFKRVQNASVRAAHRDGLIAPGDLVTAVKVTDKSKDKASFARGDALLQKFAQDAQAVLPSKVPDSGTAGRMKTGIAGRVLGGGVGAALGSHLGGLGAEIGAGLGLAIGDPLDAAISVPTNALKAHLMSKEAGRLMSRAPRTGGTRNYLRAADQRLKGTYLPSAAPPGQGRQP